MSDNPISRTFKQIQESAFVVFPAQTTLDIGLVLQIGAAILLDKPLILLLTPGVTPSRKLRAIADEIIPVPVPRIDGRLDDETTAAVSAAISRILSKANHAVQ